jgi:hypothetical protein
MASPASPHCSVNAEGPLQGLAAVTALAALAGFALAPAPALAQRQLWMLGPGSEAAPSAEVVPTNCVTAPDGTITCDTELRNPPRRTPARPSLELFEN